MKTEKREERLDRVKKKQIEYQATSICRLLEEVIKNTRGGGVYIDRDGLPRHEHVHVDGGDGET